MKIALKIILIYFLILSSLVCVPAIVFAQTTPTTSPAVDSSLPIITNPLAAPNLSVQIPGLTSFGQVTCDSTSCTIPWLSNYINGLYRYGIGAVVILAVITMIIAGVVWITAGGKEERISDAKQWVAGSLMGLLVAFSSYIILDIINPALIVLSPLKITYVPKIDLDITPMQETPTNDVVGTTIQSKGQQCFLDTFGNSESAVQHNLVSISMFGKYIQVNKLAADAFTRVNNQLYGQVNYNFYDLGTFAWRANRNNASSLSLHSFGIAIDINPKQNPNSKTSKKPCQTDLPATVINTFKSNGFRWGGDYKTVCDAMHFEWLGPCQK